MTWFAYLWWATLREIRNAIHVWLYVTCVHLCVNIQMWVYLWRFGAIVILTGREISFHSCCNETPYGGWSSLTVSSFSSVCFIFTIITFFLSDIFTIVNIFQFGHIHQSSIRNIIPYSLFSLQPNWHDQEMPNVKIEDGGGVSSQVARALVNRKNTLNIHFWDIP